MVLIKNIAMGEFFEGFYLIKSVELRRTRAGQDILAIVFQDRTGTISGNIWDANPKAVKQFVAGRVVHMKALKELYNGMPQVNRISLRLPEGSEPANPADYRENIIKLNILMIEYIKQTCYNAITSKKHSLFTMILYREIRLPKLLTADIFIPNW